MATKKCSSHAKKQIAAKPKPGKAEPVDTQPVSAAPRIAANLVFAEPQPMPDPSVYKEPHASDTTAYDELAQLTKLHQFNPLPFCVVSGVTEPVMTLATALGSGGAEAEKAIEN
jgi:hypothetical protein